MLYYLHELHARFPEAHDKPPLEPVLFYEVLTNTDPRPPSVVHSGNLRSAATLQSVLKIRATWMCLMFSSPMLSTSKGHETLDGALIE